MSETYERYADRFREMSEFERWESRQMVLAILYEDLREQRADIDVDADPEYADGMDAALDAVAAAAMLVRRKIQDVFQEGV